MTEPHPRAVPTTAVQTCKEAPCKRQFASAGRAIDPLARRERANRHPGDLIGFVVHNHHIHIMFKKALAHHTNATPIRSSARRALVTSIFAQYPALSEHVTEGVEEGKLSEKDLGRALVPEGVRSSNFETSAGIEGVSLHLGRLTTDNVSRAGRRPALARHRSREQGAGSDTYAPMRLS